MTATFKIPRNKLRPYWTDFCKLYDEFYDKLYKLEQKMSTELCVPDMEFFKAEWGGDYCGIGNVNRTMKLEQFDPE